MKRLKWFIAGCLLLLAGAPLWAEEQDPVEPTLADLVREAEFVALAQLDQTDYKTIRGFPREGVAWMRPLMVYKSDRKVETFTVFDEGLEDDRCYFPETGLWQEGPRYLVFLKHEESIRYRGLRPVCHLPVAVASDNQYVLRLPAGGIRLPAELLELEQSYHFVDPGSRIDATELVGSEKRALAASHRMKDEGETLVYTRGIPITAVRKYIRKILTEHEKEQRLRKSLRGSGGTGGLNR